ncbi:3822_t:CDS:2 [Cetraspora pellucida]|uniref:3822_t:CDS:1 n=1 Tax=Cetraspora pellucida TaxID=1433469 RepID=A0ACA9KM46_9GLOM|nr:3822_t:CDS:2 [Cetraspora pellucida]
MEYIPILAERERIAEDILTNKQLMDKDNVKTYIEKDQESLESGISSLRETVKEKMAELEKLETGDDKISKGFKLRGMSSNELYNITKE